MNYPQKQMDFLPNDRPDTGNGPRPGHILDPTRSPSPATLTKPVSDIPTRPVAGRSSHA